MYDLEQNVHKMKVEFGKTDEVTLLYYPPMKTRNGGIICTLNLANGLNATFKYCY